MKFKKLIAGILTLAIALNTTPRINAETVPDTSESAEMSVSEENMEISGANSFGNMVARELAAASDEQEANNGCNVFSVEVNGNTASVSFETLYDSALVVAIYDNEGVQMITSGYTEVTAEKTEAEVEISGTIPQYFYIRAYLVNPDTLRPLSTEYTSPMYTNEMQEFLSKTTADFDPDMVLNFDDDPNTNFAVFNEDTTLVDVGETADGERNILVSADDAAMTYVFGNPDESITGLKAGDVFAFENAGELIILKTVSMTVDKETGNAALVGQQAELEEVFKHLRIDGYSNSDNAEIDDSNMGEGVTCGGLIDDEDESGIAP